MEDREIVVMYFERNETAIKETIKKYDNYLSAIANRNMIHPEDAKECINDTYNAAWNSIPPNEPENLRTYLGKILRRQILMRLRREQTEKRVSQDVILSINELDEVVSDGRDFSSEIEAGELARIISDFLRKRNIYEREVFISRYYYFKDIKSIAKETGYSEGKVKMMLKRVRDNLACYLKKEGYL